MKVETKFPFVESFGDYHDIDHKVTDLKEYVDDDATALEVAFDGDYWGVFFLDGLRPTTLEIREMLVEAGWDESLNYSRFEIIGG